MKNIATNFEEYKTLMKKSQSNNETFWAEIAESFTWQKKWEKVHSRDMETPDNNWFSGAKGNITENCLDRHLDKDGDKTAIIWEKNESGEAAEHISFRELHERVCRVANVLKKNGIQKGDRVCFYLPMIPELAICVLACARIGAVHSVVFAGFSAASLSDRIDDCNAKMVITSDFLLRGKKKLCLKDIVDEAVQKAPSIETVLVVQRLDGNVPMTSKDKWLHEELEQVDAHCAPEPMDAEDPLFILYTSGSTGKPKGIQHTTAGYMVYAEYSFRSVFQPKENDIYWCTADIGWITGHTYIVYGPLLAGTTSVMFEGIPTYPDAGRFWETCDKLNVSLFYTAPTAIRALMAQGNEHVEKHSLKSLRVIGSVGEPINKEAWEWYKEKIGNHNCPVVDTWWQTETGGIMISSLAGVTPEKASHAAFPLPGIHPVLLTADGELIEENNQEGLLCIKNPWPSMLRTIYGDHKRCKETYFSAFKDFYFTGDGAKRDENGWYKIIGRVDDVINVSGHRIGTAEVESAIGNAENIVENAVVGYPHDIKGQGIYAYVICEKHPESDSEQDEMRRGILKAVTKIIGPIAKPDKIQFVTGLPKTRSGKIMRRILRKIASKDAANLGDTSTLLDPTVVDTIKEKAL